MELLKREDLHEYQVYSVDFIKKNPIAALLLSCGLGKTVTTLTAINDLMYDDFEVMKVLVVCPLSSTMMQFFLIQLNFNLF